jgi:hypothetical protein
MTQATNGRTRIFISYRRDDARGASGRLYDWLRIAFGREQVFRDVASIGPGKWRQKIDDALAASAVCLPVIGLRWCDATNGPRLAEEGDMVRHELITALAHTTEGLTIILTLVEGAKVPKKTVLPVELHDLLEWNAYPLSEEGWEDDVRRLIQATGDCTGQVPAADLDDLIKRVAEAEARMRAQEQEKHLQRDQIRALTETVAALTTQLAERPASQRAELTAALEALGRGDTTGAEAEFERVLEERSVAADAAAQEAAEAARHIANLALLNDIGKAVRYYRRACELVPGNANGWRLLGQAYIVAGNTSQAQEALTRALIEVERGHDRWEHMVALTILGDLASRTEHLGEALKHYEAARNIVLQETVRDPANTQWQRDLSVSQNKIGDVLVAQGDGPGALAAYRKGLAIGDALAARDPANVQWQVDVAVSCAKLGTHPGLVATERRTYLRRGLNIQQELKASGRLAPNQDWIGWFKERLEETTKTP